MNLGSIDLSKLDALRPILPFPLWQKAAVLAGGFVVVVGLYVYLLWLPLYEEIEQVQGNVDQQQKMLAAAVNNLDGLLLLPGQTGIAFEQLGVAQDAIKGGP